MDFIVFETTDYEKVYDAYSPVGKGKMVAKTFLLSDTSPHLAEKVGTFTCKDIS